MSNSSGEVHLRPLMHCCQPGQLCLYCAWPLPSPEPQQMPAGSQQRPVLCVV